MEQDNSQSSGNEEPPYTVVVQIPNPYGETTDPIYVFGNQRDSNQINELYRAANMVESEPNVIYVQDGEGITEESGETEEHGGENVMGDGDSSAMALLASPIRIIAHPHAKSYVWQHFGFVPLGDSDTPDRRRVLCRLCLRELPYCGNTTNLQYHLQRYHRDVVPAGMRELRPSPRTTRRASRLPDPIGDVAQLVVVEASPEARRRGSYARRPGGGSYVAGAPPMSMNTSASAVASAGGGGGGGGGGESAESGTGGGGGQPGQWHWHSSRKQQLANHITRSLVTDCLPIDTVEGPGFQSLVKLLDPNFEFQKAQQFRSQLLPALHQEEKKRILACLNGLEYCSLTLDVWKSREVDLCYLGVACHFVNHEWVVDSRYLATLEHAQGQDAEDLMRRLHRLLAEWRLTQRWAVTGTTAPEYSDIEASLIHSALNDIHLPHVPCLASTLQHAANKAMQVASVDNAIKRVRLLINHVQRTPELRIKIQDRLKSQNLELLPSSLPRLASWFQVFNVLQALQAGRDCIHAVLTESREDTNALLPSAKDSNALEALQTVLKPLNEAAETLSGDPYPSVSLVLPLLYKLTQVNLAESADDTTLLADLKNLARKALDNAYLRDDTQQLLRMAMFLDPRLKRLPFFNKDQKAAVQKLIRNELVKVIKKQGGAGTANSATYRSVSSPAGKKPKLAALLEDIFAVPSNSVDHEEEHGSGKEISHGQVTSSLSLPENIAQSELQCYENEEAVSLEEPQPLRWWKAREGQYKFLSRLARRFLCICATAVPMRRVLTTEGQAWTDRRAVLPTEDVTDVLFLSHNYGGGSGSLLASSLLN